MSDSVTQKQLCSAFVVVFKVVKLVKIILEQYIYIDTFIKISCVIFLKRAAVDLGQCACVRRRRYRKAVIPNLFSATVRVMIRLIWLLWTGNRQFHYCHGDNAHLGLICSTKEYFYYCVKIFICWGTTAACAPAELYTLLHPCFHSYLDNVTFKQVLSCAFHFQSHLPNSSILELSPDAVRYKYDEYISRTGAIWLDLLNYLIFLHWCVIILFFFFKFRGMWWLQLSNPHPPKNMC